MYYADMKSENSTINIAIAATSFGEAVIAAEAWCAGFYCGSGKKAEVVNITSGTKPRGKTYFRLFSDADAIRRGLAI